MSVQIENEIIMRPINTVRPYVRNPRKNNKTVELLCKIIPRVGFNVPLVIDEKGIIVKGHARFTAAIRLGMQEVPCIITHADEEAIKADRITDNKISEFSEWVTDELMQEINEMDFDLSDIGLPKLDLDDVPTVDTVNDDLKKDERPVISEEKRQQLYEEFRKEQSEAQVAETMQALEDFGNTPYYKCVCDKCGYTMFIKEGEL